MTYVTPEAIHTEEENIVVKPSGLLKNNDCHASAITCVIAGVFTQKQIDGINEAKCKIEKAFEDIDDIAFNTNILSLDSAINCYEIDTYEIVASNVEYLKDALESQTIKEVAFKDDRPYFRQIEYGKKRRR